MHKIIITGILGILAIYGCSTFELDQPVETGSTTSRQMSLEEAKKAFERNYMTALTKGAGETHTKLSPGEFTPLWNESEYSENGLLCSYDVNMISARKLTAIQASFRNGRSTAGIVNVYQKLVVVKNKESDRINSYILTLIPHVNYDTGTDVRDGFLNCERQKGRFTGVAIYSRMCSDAIVRVDRYVDGKLRAGVFIPSGEGTFMERVSAAAKILKGISLRNVQNLASKSFGEDDWGNDDWDYGSTDDYEDIGDGLYAGDDGSIYFDSDGDGDIDSEMLEPSIVYGEDDEIFLDYTDPFEGYPDDTDGGYTYDDYWEDGYYWDYDSSNNEPADNPKDNNEPDEELELGKEGFAKITDDLKSGNVSVRQYVEGGLAGFSFGMNTYGIFPTVAQFLEGAADDTLLKVFGKSLGATNLIISGCQTVMILFDDDGEVSAGEWMTIISTALGASAALFPVTAPVAGVLGITSAIVGMASLFVSENIVPGWYEIYAPNGDVAYVYIGSPIVA